MGEKILAIKCGKGIIHIFRSYTEKGGHYGWDLCSIVSFLDSLLQYMDYYTLHGLLHWIQNTKGFAMSDINTLVINTNLIKRQKVKCSYV